MNHVFFILEAMVPGAQCVLQSLRDQHILLGSEAFRSLSLSLCYFGSQESMEA